MKVVEVEHEKRTFKGRGDGIIQSPTKAVIVDLKIDTYDSRVPLVMHLVVSAESFVATEGTESYATTDCHDKYSIDLYVAKRGPRDFSTLRPGPILQTIRLSINYVRELEELVQWLLSIESSLVEILFGQKGLDEFKIKRMLVAAGEKVLSFEKQIRQDYDLRAKLVAR